MFTLLSKVWFELWQDKSRTIQVTLVDGRIDTYLISFDGKQSMTYYGVKADAVIAASSSLGGKSDLWVVGGTEATDGTRTLTADLDERTGEVAAVHRQEDGGDDEREHPPRRIDRDEAQHLRHFLHEVPGLVIHLHLYEHVSGEEFSLAAPLASLFHLDHLFGRDEDLSELVLQAHALDALFQGLLHLVLEIRIGVNDVPP